MFIVTGLSLLLLVYVGIGEGKRTYEQFEIEKLTSQGRTLTTSINANLRDGLPLKQFAGFSTLAEGIVNGIDEVDAIAVYDNFGQQLFIAIDKKGPTLPQTSDLVKQIKDAVEVEKGDTHIQVVLPLKNRFETAGSLVVMASRAALNARLNSFLQPLLIIVLCLSTAFSLGVWMLAPHLAHRRMPWLQIGYATTFLVMAAAVIVSLIMLYSEAVQSKTEASATTLSTRFSDVVRFNLRFEHLDGVEKVFQNYARSNPDISEASLILEGAVRFSSNPQSVGKPWISDDRNFEYKIDLSNPDQSVRRFLVVSAPTAAVYGQVERSVRNFAALFIASAFFAGLFLQVVSSLPRLRMAVAASDASETRKSAEEESLVIVKPIFFLAVFIEHLLYSFLPKFMQDAASASGTSLAYAAAPFTAYYLCFAISLIPSGRFAERYGPRRLILAGLILASCGVLGLALPIDIQMITLLRGMAGVGQGMVFIGVQAYVLSVTSEERKTQGAAIIVFGFQGGMISGMAIGSLLVNYLGPQGVFAVSALIGIVAAIYSVLLIPRVHVVLPREIGGDNVGLVEGLKRVLTNREFLHTMFCVGVPAKAILTGAITFGLPLLLGQRGYRAEDIGQVIMLYAISVVVANMFISRIIDQTGRTVGILFAGTAISGGGLCLLGLMNSPTAGLGSAMVIIAGVVAIGIAHGFINAPVVTHVAHSEISNELGANSVTTTYRFLERVGHVIGPMLIAQCFLIWGESPQIFVGIGITTAILGLLFLMTSSAPRERTL